MGRDGFSLLSLLAALAIIGIVFVIGAPRLSVLMPKARLEGAARNLASEIQRARFRAIAEGVPYRVSFDGANRRFQVCRATTGAPTVFSVCDAAKEVDEANSIQIAATSATTRFNPRGVTEQTTVVTLTARGGEIRRVGTRTSGNVYVQ